MAAPLWRLSHRRWGRIAVPVGAAALFALPLLLALPLTLHEAGTKDAWRDLWADPQLPRALLLSLSSGVLSTALACIATLFLLTQLHGTALWSRLGAGLGPMLAVPHAAFAIGLAWLMAPAGWLARGLAPLAGWDTPPDITTVNDPQGWALITVLVLKELPFLLWSALALFNRPEVALTLRREVALARTLGYSAQSWWWRVGWLQWAPRLAWPVLAVMAYGLTVVDLALLVGPGSPPTLAVLTWQGLSDSQPARNAQGAASALLLTVLLAGLATLGWCLWRAGRGVWLRIATRGDRRSRRSQATRATWAALGLAIGLAIVYGAVCLSLLTLSFAGAWRFPALLPELITFTHWEQVAASLDKVGFTAVLGLAASASALVLAVAWLETAPTRWDESITPLVLMPLVVPQLLLMVGLYQGALWLHLDGTVWGLWWVHGVMLLPYVFTALAPAWRSFDVRYEWAALAMGRSRWAYWWRVKWPLLAPPLASALAIGFAVSVAQYLSTQFIGAGRHTTLTTEAVTLASGGQRSMSAAFALLQALLPALGFAAAYGVGRRAARSITSPVTSSVT